MILAILGYLVLIVLAWVVCHVFIFTASRAWHRGRAQSESQVTEEIRRWDDSLNSSEILRHLSENADRSERVLNVSNILLGVVRDMNQSVGFLLEMETKRMAEHEDEPPIPPSLVS